MSAISRKALGGVLATAVLAGALVVGIGGASAEQARGGGGGNPVTIAADVQGGKLVFDGPSQVREGARLRVVNRTSPRRVGPHTFSLVRQGELPETNRQERRCFAGDNVCARIARAHRVDFQTGEVARPSVERGENGWDRRFGRTGDSFFTETKDEKHTRRVAAKAGERLWFMCAIHPDMQKRVNVVG